MDLGDIIEALLNFFGDLLVCLDINWFRWWRFFLCLFSTLALAGLLDWLTGSHVPGRFLYFPLGLAGSGLGLLWELSHERG